MYAFVQPKRLLSPNLSSLSGFLCSRAGSKRCETVRPHLLDLAQSADWGERVVHAKSDISDQRGYTSYIEKYGVLKLPTIVLFRRGHPAIYPYDRPLTQEAVTSWLESATRTDMLPRGASDGADTVLQACDATCTMCTHVHPCAPTCAPTCAPACAYPYAPACAYPCAPTCTHVQPCAPHVHPHAHPHVHPCAPMPAAMACRPPCNPS